MASVIGRPDPYTVVILEGIRLPAYVAGGLNVSVGQLARVDYADVRPGRASGAEWLSGPGFQFFVTSGSGNIVTIKAMGTGSGEMPAGQQLSCFPVTLIAYGH